MARPKKDKPDAKTAKAVETLKKPGTKPGRYSSGNNLYLLVGRGGRQRSWTYVYRWHGKLTATGLGSAFEVALGDARKAATACRKQLDDGIKPGSQDGVEPGTAPLFGTIADQVIEAKSAAWKGDDGEKRWTYQLSRRRDEDGKLDGTGYCQKLVNRPVDAITEQDVVGAINGIWMTKQRQAELTRQMIEAVLHAGGRRGADNPAALENIKHSLATQNATVKHCAAHPYQTAPEFMARLRADSSTGARCLEFLILTWTRDREAREARWCEIDRANAIWRVPPERMKRPREGGFCVPLSPAALTILDEQAKRRPADDAAGSAYIFPGIVPGRPVSNKLFRNLMHRLGADATIHGWRSCGRTWCAETTDHADGVAEAALSHFQRDRTAAAYNRGPLLAKRARLMLDWSTFLAGQTAAKGLHLRRRRVRRLMIRKPAPVLAIAA